MSEESQVTTQRVTAWDAVKDRHWPGPNFWANRLQDWSVRDGQLKCSFATGGWNWRTAHLLSHDLNAQGDRFRLELDMAHADVGQAGLLFAAGEGGLNHQQASLIQSTPGMGGGFLAVVDFKHQRVSIRDFGELREETYPEPVAGHREVVPLANSLPERFTLVVQGDRADEDRFLITAKVVVDGGVLAESAASVPADRLVGNVAITSIGAKPPAVHAFRELRVGGDRITAHDDRAFGPIAGVLYSVANGDLKVGVQCVSLGKTITPPGQGQPGGRLAVRLQRQDAQGEWQPVGPPAGVSEPDYYALLRVKNHDTTQAHRYRVVLNGKGDLQASYAFEVPAEPDGDSVIAGISCTGNRGRGWNGQRNRLKNGDQFVGRWTPANLWAPFEGITQPLVQAEPDIVFFTGDQLYEGNPTPQDKTDAFPTDDYLYKWLIWHWSFGDVTRRFPSILQTDDHDVWHPNLWGDGGRLMTRGWDAGGGFINSHYFVNLVQRTMCGHNPDAYDPGPLDSGVTNYFTTFTYGGVDFALLEDRKFKSAARDANRQAVPLELLGDTQMQMLADWADDPERADVRVIVSQSVYAKLSTNKDGIIGQDRDTNSWPKAARDRAVELFERSGAVLFTGDQHLASVSRLETTDGPGVLQFCQPSGGCIWWRWFYPNAEQHRGALRDDAPGYVGRFVDGAGNPFEVLAVANPGPASDMGRRTNPQSYVVSAREAAADIGAKHRMHRGEGFALIRVKPDRSRLVLECWPNGTDFSAEDAPAQFMGWPIEVGLDDLQILPATPR
ncbi:MAG: alkaline phosphatase D family protein [Planctomycetota bacterium]